MDNYSIILLILILFFPVGAVIRHQEGTWITPVSLLCLLWIFLMIFSVILAPEYYFSPAAFIYIITIMLACFAGSRIYAYTYSKLGRKRTGSTPDGEKIISHDTSTPFQNSKAFSNERKRFLLLYVVFSIFASLAATVVLLHGYGFSASSLFSLDSYIMIASSLSENRYAEVREPFGTALLLSIGFSGNLIAGLLYVVSESRTHKLVSVLSLVSVLLYTIVYTARAPFLFSVILFISSFLSTTVFIKRGEVTMLTYKNIFTVIIFGFFLLALFMGTQLARMDIREMSYEEAVRMFDHLKGAFAGNVSPFCIWFDMSGFNNPASWGSYSFAGIFELMGIAKREAGLFTESFDINNSFNYSNIFTLFRVVIEDYTLAGSYIFFLVSGFVSSLIFREVKNRKIIFIPLLAAVFAFYLWSFIVSIFAYNTIIFAFLIYGTILAVIEFRNGK